MARQELFSPFQSFVAGRQARQSQDYAATRNKLAEMELADAPAQMQRRNALADIQMEGAQVGLENSRQQLSADKAKYAYAMLKQAQDSGNPKAFITSQIPDLAEKLRQQGVDINAMDDESVMNLTDQLTRRYAGEAGILPASTEEQAFTLKPGEARYRGDKVIAERAPEPESPPAPSFQHVVLENGNIGAFDSRSGRITDTGQKAPPNASAENRTFTRADKLRDEYNSASKEFVTVGDSFTRVTEAARDPSAAGDLSMIFAYMKMLDPNSVVREQEFANAQNAAGVPDRVRAAWNKALRGERLAPAQRSDFLRQAQKLYEGQKKRHEATIKRRYTDMAKRWSIDPADVVGDLDVGLPQQEAAPPASQPSGQEVRVNSIEQAMTLPPGTVFITPDGRRKVR